MRTKNQKIILFFLILFIAIIILLINNPFRADKTESEKNVGLGIGQLAPNFELKDIEGKSISLKQFRNDKAVILNFWASWCAFCKEEMPLLEKVFDENKDKIIVIGINLQEDPEVAIKFAKELDINYPILFDQDSKVTNIYNVKAQPTTYFIDKEGIIEYKRLGPLSEEEIFEKVKEIVKIESEIKSLNEEIKTLSDGTKYIIHPDELISGGPKKDGIPSIDNPKFIKAEDADFLSDDELVVGLNINNVVRAYPLQILVWHEIVNDFFNDKAVLVTYCPLCGTAIAFDRTINGEAVEFGVSGLLYNSNLVMYDRKTETLWNQVGGKAIVGEFTGKKLNLLPANTLTWGEWKKEYPETLVLSKDSGFIRSYGLDPYNGYYTSKGLYFPVKNEDDSLHPKAVVYGIELNGKYKAYPDEKINLGKTEDSFAGVSLEVIRTETNLIEIRNKETKELIPFERHFWFSWFAFHPETEIF